MPRMDPYDIECPTRAVLERITDKWTVLVIGRLAGGSRRFSEIKREVGAISTKVLSQVLRDLERDGLVTRTVSPTVPPRVDYALTVAGRTLIDLVEHIHAWAVQHADVVFRARQQAAAGPSSR